MDEKPKKIGRSLNVSSRETPGGSVILSHETGDLFSLNDTGTEIWEHCGEGRTADEIVSFMSQKYGLQTESFRTEILSYVEQLLQAGFFRIL